MNGFTIAEKITVCPRCGALPGEPCRTRSGGKTRDGIAHHARYITAACNQSDLFDFMRIMPSDNLWADVIELEALYKLPDLREQQ